MKLNWKLRFQNKQVLSALIAEIVAVVYYAAQMFGVNFNIPSDSWIQLGALIIAVLVTLGIIVDPTTKGVSDSKQALGYSEPKDDNQVDEAD